VSQTSRSNLVMRCGWSRCAGHSRGPLQDVAEMSSRRHMFETGAGSNLHVTNEGLGVAGIAAPRGFSRTGDGPGVFAFFTGGRESERRERSAGRRERGVSQRRKGP